MKVLKAKNKRATKIELTIKFLKITVPYTLNLGIITIRTKNRSEQSILNIVLVVLTETYLLKMLQALL